MNITNNTIENYNYKIISAGSTYLDIDAYACMVAMAELLCLQGENAIAYSDAKWNYSVCKSLISEVQTVWELPEGFDSKNAEYIIVDVSDPNYLAKSISLDRIVAVYDHHVGFEEYWNECIGEGSHIEFIGAAATLIYREWKKAGLEDMMSSSTAKLLIAAILDNTLNLTSSVTTQEDIDVFNKLCTRENIDEKWCARYFSEVQASIESDLKNALLGDVKYIGENQILPPYMGQIAIWQFRSLLERVAEICDCFYSKYDCWILNVIDIQHNCNYFICDSREYQQKIEMVFNVHFEEGIAKTSTSYLRKEIIKKLYIEFDLKGTHQW